MVMEGNKILDTASELHTVNELLNKYVREQALSHEEKRGLWLFYKEFKDTNTLIDFAETVAHENIDKLLTDSQKLLGEAEECIEIFEKSATGLSDFESKTASEWFIEPFKEAYQTESGKANVLWKKFTSLSNHLDCMFYEGYTQEEIDKVEKECDDTLKEYNKQKALYEQLYKQYREELKKYSGLAYFDISLLNILSTKLVAICRSILHDITRIKQEGGI